MYNYEGYLSTNCQINQALFTAVIAPRKPRMGPMTLEPKKCSDFFWLNSKTTKTQSLKLDNEKVKMDSPIIGYVRICDDPLTHVFFFYQ